MTSLHTIDEYTKIIKENIQPLNTSESLPLTECLYRVSAGSIVAPFDVPEFAQSAMDGYAMSASDWRQGQSFTVSQKIMADSIPRTHQSGTLARIFTGGTVPAGADCVVIQENSTATDDGQIRITQAPQSGDNIRAAASSFAYQQQLIAAGRLMTPASLALAAMTGLCHIHVKSKIRVRVFALGDELLEPGAQHQSGKIYDSNSSMILALLHNMGCQVTRCRLADNQDTIATHFAKAAIDNDLVISCGGASVGERDYVHRVIHQIGQVHAWKVAVKPGKPLIFGSIHAHSNTPVPFFGLPGNPGSSLVTLGLFVRVAIYRLLGIQQRTPISYRLPVINSYQGNSDRHQFICCRYIADSIADNSDGTAGLIIEDQRNSASLLSAAAASGLCHVKPQQHLQSGDMVHYYPFDTLFSLTE